MISWFIITSEMTPMESFHKAERTDAGTSLVSSLMRNAACSLAKQSSIGGKLLTSFRELKVADNHYKKLFPTQIRVVEYGKM